MRCRREEGGEGRNSPCPPSYHAASMGPLIFAALRFCLALSTLHTSTADRRHKTLYRDSVGREEERKGKGERGRKGIARESLRPDGCTPLCPLAYTTYMCMHNVCKRDPRNDMLFPVLYHSAEVRDKTVIRPGRGDICW